MGYPLRFLFLLSFSVLVYCTVAIQQKDSMKGPLSEKQDTLPFKAVRTKTPCKEEYLAMSTDAIFTAATSTDRVGGCWIARGGSSSFCDLYVNTATVGNGYRGWPRTPDDRGTGCVKAPELPKGLTHCFFNDPQYDLTSAERTSFCTNNGKENAVAQLKHAIANDQCDIPSCDTHCQDYYLSLSNADLYRAATDGRKVGGCGIGAGSSRSFCDLYVTTATVGTTGYRGWPRTPDGRGTGCVKAPEFPKRRTHCFFHDTQYDLTDTERASFCTNSGRDNAVAQLRHAIAHDQCEFTSCMPLPSPSPQVTCPCRCHRWSWTAKRECRRSPFRGNCSVQRCSRRSWKCC